MGSQYSILCSGSKPSCDVHSSLQYDAESTLSIVWHSPQIPSPISIEALRPLRTSGSCKYSEKLAYESTCCCLWAQGIQTQIQDEQEKVHKWIEGMTEDLLRAKRASYAQPHWVPSMLNPLQPAAPPVVQPQQASSSSATMVPVKPAPLNRNPSMASASMVDLWADAKMKQQR